MRKKVLKLLCTLHVVLCNPEQMFQILQCKKVHNWFSTLLHWEKKERRSRFYNARRCTTGLAPSCSKQPNYCRFSPLTPSCAGVKVVLAPSCAKVVYGTEMSDTVNYRFQTYLNDNNICLSLNMTTSNCPTAVSFPPYSIFLTCTSTLSAKRSKSMETIIINIHITVNLPGTRFFSKSHSYLWCLQTEFIEILHGGGPLDPY